MHSLFKLLSHSQVFKDVYREVGILEVLTSLLHALLDALKTRKGTVSPALLLWAFLWIVFGFRSDREPTKRLFLVARYADLAVEAEQFQRQ